MKKPVFLILGILALAASAAMFVIGSNSGHLSELRDGFWLPIPLGLIFLSLGAKA